MEFKDAEFMKASEKEFVLKDWKRFVRAVLEDTGETVADRHGNNVPGPFVKFSKRLYEHLHLHCSFIAHYDRCGFYSTYFDDPAETVRFIRQFDSDHGCVSVEYGGNWWLQGDYEDLNTAMCAELDPIKADLYSKLTGQEKENDLQEAAKLAEKWGHKIHA